VGVAIRSDDRRLVLVLDADGAVRRTLEKLILDHGQRAESACAAWEAADVFEQRALALVLLDFGDSSCDEAGLNLVKTLRPEIPVIATTRSATVAGAVSALRAGAHDYFQKPFEDLERLRTAISVAVDRAPRATDRPNGLFQPDYSQRRPCTVPREGRPSFQTWSPRALRRPATDRS
jgi:DNA-binding NtrC family response regulator